MQRIIYLALFLLISLFSANAQNRAELEKQRADIQREIEDVTRSLNQTKKNRKESLGQLSLLQRKLRLREKAINNINQQISSIQTTINHSREDIDKLKAELDTLKLQYEKSIVYAYKNRNNYDFLNFIFSANSFNDALKRVEYLKSYRNYREQHAANIKSTQLLLQKKIQGLESSRKEKDKVLESQEKQKQVLVEEKKEKNSVVSKLKSREKELSRDLAAKKKADNKLRAAIKTAIERETRLARQREIAEAKKRAAAGGASPESATSTAKNEKADESKKSVFEATPEGAIISDNFEKNKGRLPWPVERGVIKTPYGNYGIEGTKIVGNNPGITIETQPGAAVRTVFDGDVSSVFDIEGTSVVLVRHGKFFTTYSGLSSVSVSKGDKVKTGQVIGKASSEGEIEFLLLLENKKQNPELWLRK